MNVVSFSGYTPSPRYDGRPWTEVQIEESYFPEGPWTLIDTIALSPLDADPTQPMSRSFTTEHATLTNGWYRIVWLDATADKLYADPVYNEPPPAWTTTVQQVATYLLSRTVNQYGVRLGTFTSDTTPTATEVLAIIETVILEITDVIGDTIPTFLYDDASNVVALRAAMQVELAFYPDQVNTGRSIYPQLKEMYEFALENLVKQITAASDSSTGAVVSGVTNAAKWSFPTSGEWLTRVW